MKKNIKTRALSLILAISMVIPNSSSITSFAASDDDKEIGGWEKIPDDENTTNNTSSESDTEEDADLTEAETEEDNEETYEREYMLYNAPDADSIASDFPASVTLEDNNSDEASVDVTWECDEYDPESIGIYYFTATPEITEGSSSTDSEAISSDDENGASEDTNEAELEEDTVIDYDAIPDMRVEITANYLAEIKTEYNSLTYTIGKAPSAEKIIKSLDETVDAVLDLDGGTEVSVPVTHWDYEYNPDEIGEYIFTPVIDDETWIVSDDIEMPELIVSVEAIEITEFTSEFKTFKYEIGDVPDDVTAKMAGTIKVVTVDGKKKISVESWQCENFDPEKTGTYRFTPVISDNYRLAKGVELPTQEVVIADPSETRLEAECGDITVVVEANKGVIPSGTKLKVTEVTGDEYDQYAEATLEATGDPDSHKVSFVLDVKLVDKKGNEADLDTSNGDIKVTFLNGATSEEAAEEAVVYHFEDDDIKNITEMETIADGTDLSVVTDSFSIYSGSEVMTISDNDDSSPKNGNGLSDDASVSIRLKSGAKKIADGEYLWTPVSDTYGHQFTFRLVYKGSVTGDIAPSTVTFKADVKDSDGNTVTKTYTGTEKGVFVDEDGNTYIGNGQSLSYTIDGGGIQMRIPKSVLKLKDGTRGDTYQMSIPSTDDLMTMTSEDISQSEGWAWFEDGDDIVIYNFLTKQAFDGYIDIAYATSKKTQNYLDYDSEDPNASKSGDVKVKLTAPSIEGGTLEREAGPLNLYIDTKATITSTYKKYPTNTSKFPSGWGTYTKLSDTDGDSSDYYWQVWEITSTFSGRTQSYDFTILDHDLTAVRGDGTEVPAEIYAYSVAGKGLVLNTGDVVTNGVTVTGLSTYETRYDYVLTRVKKSDVAASYEYDSGGNITGKILSASFKMNNQVNAAVHPVDDVDDDTEAAATRDFAWTLPTFITPSGKYTLEKYGDENWGGYWNVSAWHASRPYSSYDLDKIQEQTQESLSGINYALWVVGDPYPDTYDETKGTDDEWTKYGWKKVTYVISDSQFYPLNADGTDLNGTIRFAGTLAPTQTDLDAATPLEWDDYDIEYINYNFFFNDVVRDEDGNPTIDEDTANYTSVRVQTKEYKDDEVFEVYTKTDDNDYVYAGSYQINSGKWTPADDSLVSSMTSSRITFKKDADGKTNVDGFKIVTSNAYYHANMCFYPYVTIYGTDNVLNWTGKGKLGAEGSTAKDAVLLKNIGNLKVYANDTEELSSDNQVFEEDDMVGDRLRATERDSYVAKTVSGFSNDVKKKAYNITWKAGAYETYTTGTGDSAKSQFMLQESGTFYDLLPEGSSLLDGSVTVVVPSSGTDSTDRWFSQGSGTTLSDNAFTVSTIDNYKSSGRTMLVVKIKEAGYGYKVYYTTVHSWDSIGDYGKDAKNPVAYETGNDSITNGFPDDPSAKNNKGNTTNALSDKNKTLYKDLDSSTDAYKFLYAEDKHDIAALTAASTGLSKRVISSTGSLWTYDTTVSPDETYRYRLRYSNTDTTMATNLVMFDTMENFYLSDDHGDVPESEWKGTLTSIDLSQAKNVNSVDKDGNRTDATANPVVYYSTAENLDLDVEENHNIDNASVWKKLTDSTDLSTVNAIAIDMRKASDGSDFILPEDASFTVVLYMKAPHTIKDTETDKYPETYNNIYMQNNIIYESGDEESFYIHHNYTTVKYAVTADFGVHKVSSKNEDEAVSGITFRLYGESDYGTSVDMKATSDRNGELTFKKVEKGSYTLQEISGTDDWIEDHTEHKVVINGSGEVTIDGADYTSTINDAGEVVLKYVTIKNEPRIHTDISFSKRNSKATSTKVGGAQYTISGTSDYGTDVLQTATSSDPTKEEIENGAEKGLVTFTNIEKGTYTLKETKAAEGYAIDTTVYTVKVDENGNHSITVPSHINYLNETKVTNFAYTGAVQTYEAGTGVYKLEVWGAQGGDRGGSALGGMGGYSVGTLTLTEDKTLYIYAGGSGNTGGTSGGFNGGGRRTSYNGGGGASDIRIGKDSLYARVIVAGGGGSVGKTSYSGGAGGGTAGTDATSGCGTGGYGGTQTGNTNKSGYSAASQSTTTIDSNSHYAGFGFGGNGVNVSGGYGGAGGGGWYGGVGGYPDGSMDDDKGGGGGSGYVYTADTASNYPSGCLLDKSMYLSEASTTAGTGNFTSPTGTSETGHSGDGYVRITKIAEYEREEKQIEVKKDNGTYILTDDPLATITFEKRSSYDKKVLEGAEFSLKGTSKYGTVVDMTAVSDSSGLVTFTGLEKGSYILTETKAPVIKDDNGNEITFELNETKYVVKVDKDNNFTIDGMNTEGEYYVCYNTQKPDQEIKVTKIWDDGNTSHTASELAITLTTKVGLSSSVKYHIVFDANGGSFGENWTKNVVTYSATNKSIRPAQTQLVGGREETGDSSYEPSKHDGEYVVYFLGWSTKKDGSVDTDIDFKDETQTNKYLSGLYQKALEAKKNGVEEKTDEEPYTTTLYAVYSTKKRYMYATQIYGICEDTLQDKYTKSGDAYVKEVTISENTTNGTTTYTTSDGIKVTKVENSENYQDANGGTYEPSKQVAGLTFGPAVGGDYRTSSKSHTVDENGYIKNTDTNQDAGYVASDGITVTKIEDSGNYQDGNGVVYTKSGDAYTKTVAISETTADSVTTYTTSDDITVTKIEGSDNYQDASGIVYTKSGGAYTKTVRIDPYRCVHHDTWATIVDWNKKNPYVYAKCLTNGCTKGVQFTPTNANSNEYTGEFTDNTNTTGSVFNTKTTTGYTGDGASYLYNEILEDSRRWNSDVHTKDIYSNSQIRAMLNGYTYGYGGVTTSSFGYSEANSLLSGFPEVLRNAIGAKQVVARAISYSSKTTEILYDKLWLLSQTEIYGNSIVAPSDRIKEGEQYSKFTKLEVDSGSCSAVENYCGVANDATSGASSNNARYWWLRSRYGYSYSNNHAWLVDGYDGDWRRIGYLRYAHYGVAPGFTLAR